MELLRDFEDTYTSQVDGRCRSLLEFAGVFRSLLDCFYQGIFAPGVVSAQGPKRVYKILKVCRNQ